MSSKRRRGNQWVRRASTSVVGTFVAVATLAVAAAPAQATTYTPDWTFTASAAKVSDVAKVIRADAAYAKGYTGKGVGIALIDTGVVPVPGLTSGNIVNGPDLSLESQVPGLLHKDSYGHGTHLAGIIAGRDNTTGTGFRGIAPDAKLTSIKVGMANGAVDVSQVLAAIDWVVAHRNDDSANPIKIINLSYGTDSDDEDTTSNPLTHAVENAWRAGILVVVAAGNTGLGGHDMDPAFDPFITSVGATDMRGTTNPSDDLLASFSTARTYSGYATFLAPGRSIVSLRNPGSYADANYPSAEVGDRYFKGSGTSQAAAVVSGAAALLWQRFPTASADTVKFTLSDAATPLPNVSSDNQGGGEINLARVFDDGVWCSCSMSGDVSRGTGSLQAARGSSAITFGLDNTPLTGENDIFGPFSTATWAAASSNHTSWQGGSWMGHAWTGTDWTTATDNQANWAGRAWSGRAWSGRAWSDFAWNGATWSGRAWSGTTTFNGAAWAGAGWQASGWCGGTTTSHWLT